MAFHYQHHPSEKALIIIIIIIRAFIRRTISASELNLRRRSNLTLLSFFGKDISTALILHPKEYEFRRRVPGNYFSATDGSSGESYLTTLSLFIQTFSTDMASVLIVVEGGIIWLQHFLPQQKHLLYNNVNKTICREYLFHAIVNV